MSDFDDNIPNEAEEFLRLQDALNERVIACIKGIENIATQVEDGPAKAIVMSIGLAAQAVVAQLALNELELQESV